MKNPIQPLPYSEKETDLWELSDRLHEHHKQVLAFMKSEDSIGYDRKKLFNYSVQLKARLNDLAKKISIQFECDGYAQDCFSR